MPEWALLEPIDYLVIGHVTEDLTPAGPRLGGTAAYAALTARALGARAGIVTAASQTTPWQALSGIPVVCLPSQHTTTFENHYAQGVRRQILHRRAAPIPFEHVPPAWRTASIIHLGPVAQELNEEIPPSLSPSLLGLTPQGWMRAWDEAGRISSCAWKKGAAILPRAGAVVISREDVSGEDEVIEGMAQQTRLLAVTEGAGGAVLYWNGDRRRFRPPRVEEVDASGAGDIFAAAFFIRLLATRDPWEAARFATLLSARSVTRHGLEGIPTRQEIEECLVEVF